ncbi:MAG: FAD binding domain-containing protein [Proteobacteria bacterium]|nr:FAD binding domain-containing protein [Pseudomonadota bacterium]
MKPARFDYIRAETLAEAHAALAAHGGEARVLAGGQTLLPMLSMRLARPGVLVDIMRLHEIARYGIERDVIRVGAGVRQAQLQKMFELDKVQPLLAKALPWVGHAQTRARGTVCGSIAHADPSAELPLVLVALGGEVELSSARHRRKVAGEEFFTGPLSTARADDELVEAVTFPSRRPGYGYAFREFARRHGDFAIVACAAVARTDGARLAIGGVGDRPVAREFAQADRTSLTEALDAFSWELDARDDAHASAAYRRALVRQIGHAVIMEAEQCRV